MKKYRGLWNFFFMGPSVAAPGVANDLIICHNLSHSPLRCHWGHVSHVWLSLSLSWQTHMRVHALHDLWESLLRLTKKKKELQPIRSHRLAIAIKKISITGFYGIFFLENSSWLVKKHRSDPCWIQPQLNKSKNSMFTKEEKIIHIKKIPIRNKKVKRKWEQNI